MLYYKDREYPNVTAEYSNPELDWLQIFPLGDGI